MSSPKVYINEKYRKKNGTSAIYIMVHHAGQTLKFSTGVSCDPDNFNYKTHRIKGNSKKVKDENLTIGRGLARINDIFVRYRLQGETLNAETLKREWKNPARRVNFYAWMDEALKARKGEIAESSYKQHKAMKSKMETFRPKLAFADIDADFIEQYRRYLKVTKKNDLNTIHNNLKNMKAYLNIAVRQGIISENPFNIVRLRRSAPDRVFLTEDELAKLWQMYEIKRLPDTHHYVLRHFLFMCMTGIRVSDLKIITFENIMDNRLVFFPVKTKRSKRTGVRIPLNKFAWQLINDEGKKAGLLFDTISEQRMNVKLKDIVAGAGIPKKITNHSGRHTFATIYLNKTKDMAGLQRLLGHSSIAQTMIYAHINDEMLVKSMQTFEKELTLQKNPGSSEPGQSTK